MSGQTNTQSVKKEKMMSSPVVSQRRKQQETENLPLAAQTFDHQTLEDAPEKIESEDVALSDPVQDIVTKDETFAGNMTPRTVTLDGKWTKGEIRDAADHPVESLQTCENAPDKSESEAKALSDSAQDMAARTETLNENMTPGTVTSDANFAKDTARDAVYIPAQSLPEVPNEIAQMSSVLSVTEDGQVPREVLHLINGKSPDEVVNIINGQLAELKAIETLRDVEEECLDELTDEIIAKLTKESMI